MDKVEKEKTYFGFFGTSEPVKKTLKDEDMFQFELDLDEGTFIIHHQQEKLAICTNLKGKQVRPTIDL